MTPAAACRKCASGLYGPVGVPVLARVALMESNGRSDH